MKMTKRLLFSALGLVLLLLVLSYLLVLSRHVYRMGTTVRLNQKVKMMALFAESFGEEVGRYPTNLIDMATYDAGYGTELIRKWAHEQITNSHGDRYEIIPGDDGFIVMMSRPRRFLLPSVMVSNRVNEGEARYLFSPRRPRHNSRELEGSDE